MDNRIATTITTFRIVKCGMCRRAIEVDQYETLEFLPFGMVDDYQGKLDACEKELEQLGLCVCNHNRMLIDE